MNSKELIKKIDIGRVGNGTQTYNDMCLILNKEETLEHLQYVEQLEKENQELKIKNTRLEDYKINYRTAIAFMQAQKEEMQKVREENTKLKKALDILKEKLDIKLEVYHSGGCTLNHKIISNCVTSNERCLRYLEVEDYKLLKEVLEDDE